MASITTILGTDSVSSSRIVLNNNFSALNTELGTIAALLNTTTQTLSLTGEIKGGTLRINNGTIDTFKVTATGIIAEVEATFNQKVTLENALILKIVDGVVNIPTTGYTASTYMLDAINPIFASPIALPIAEDGQEITFIADGGLITFDVTNIAVSPSTPIEVAANGSITFRYSVTNSQFYVVSAMNATIVY
jgi:hypothetical protein